MAIRSVLALFALVPVCLSAQTHEHGHESHAGAADPVAAAGATSMGGAIVETPHLKLTTMREPNARDSARAAEVLRDLREGIDQYRDYICVPTRRARERWRETAHGKMKFGPAGAISTKEECDREDARFIPQLFGWMVHVSVDEGFEQHHSGGHKH